MQVVESEFAGIRIKMIQIEDISWYFIGDLISCRPSVFIQRENVSEQDYKILDLTNIGKRFVFSLNTVIKAISLKLQIAINFVQFYFNNNQVEIKKTSKIGRKRKEFVDLLSDSRRRERRKEIELEFRDKYEFVISPKNFPSLLLVPNIFKLYDYLINKFTNNIIVQKIPKSKILLSKDKAIISYGKLESLRQFLNLQFLIPCTTTLVREASRLNKILIDRYDLQLKDDGISIGNIKQFPADYIGVNMKKKPDKTLFLLKWSCDERIMKNSVGNVGLSMQLINDDEGNQNPHSQMYVAIGNGKENNEFFDKHAKKIGNFAQLILLLIVFIIIQ